MTEQTWHVHRGGETYGPYGAAAIRDLCSQGSFTGDDLWWDEPSGSWRPLTDHPALADDGPREILAASQDHPVPKAKGDGLGFPPAAGPLGSGKAAEELGAAWPMLAALVPPVPAATGTPFACEGCGGRFGRSQMAYARDSYLCPDCLKSGATARPASIIEQRNPLATLLLKHAWAWALVLMIVPFFAFQMVADMMDPYKSLPASVPALKQAIRILAKDAELKPMSWTHAIRVKLLETALASAQRADATSGDGEKDLTLIAMLLGLEALGRDSEAADLIEARSEVGPSGRGEEEARKFYLVQARILVKAGRHEHLAYRLSQIAPQRPMEPGMPPFGMMRPPTITSPLFSGQKVYDIEIAKELYGLVTFDDQAVVELLAQAGPGILRELMGDGMPVSPALGEPSPPEDASAGGWMIDQFERLKKDGAELAERIHSWNEANGTQSSRNAGIDEARISRVLETALKPILSSSRNSNIQVMSRGTDGFDARVRFTSPRAADVAGAARLVTASTLACHLLVTEMDASRYTSRNRTEWTVGMTLRAPLPRAASADARARHAAEFVPLADTTAATLQARMTTARMLVDELRRELSQLERGSAGSIAASFGPADRLLEILMGSSASLSTLRISARALHVSGSGSGGTATLESLKSRLAPLAEERGLQPAARSNVVQRDGRAITEWTLEYTSSAR